MDRRTFLSSLSAATLAGLAGCIDNSNDPTTTPGTTPEPTTQEPLDLRGAYVDSHTDEMKMLGMKMGERLNVALAYTIPHEFFLTTGRRTQRVEVNAQDTMHLMAVVWDKETGALPPSVEPSITIYRDDEEVSNVTPWAMLSQPMGYHFGDNVQINGEGTYRFEISLNEENAVTSDDLDGVFTSTDVTIEKEFNPFDANGLNQMPADNAGDPGAIPPMDMDMMPVITQPNYEDMPIEMTDAQYTNDMGVAVGTLDTPSEFDADTEQHLAVAPQTRYNQYLLPLMSIAATVTRDDDVLFEGDLRSSLDSDLGHFYGAGIPTLESGDTVSVAFNSPSQVARALGYEEAFLDLETLEFTL